MSTVESVNVEVTTINFTLPFRRLTFQKSLKKKFQVRHPRSSLENSKRVSDHEGKSSRDYICVITIQLL